MPQLTGRGDGSPQGNRKRAETQRSNLDVMSHFDPEAVLSNKQNKCGASLLTGGGSWLGVTCSARRWTDPELNPSPSCPMSAVPCWAPPSPSTYQGPLAQARGSAQNCREFESRGHRRGKKTPRSPRDRGRCRAQRGRVAQFDARWPERQEPWSLGRLAGGERHFSSLDGKGRAARAQSSSILIRERKKSM